MIRAILLFIALMAPIAAAAQGYGIRPGDTLRVEVAEDAAMNRDLLVLPDGTISFPMIGTIRASGQSTSQLAQTISAGIASNYTVPPSVNVAVAAIPEPREPRPPQPEELVKIYLMGEVTSPGMQEVPHGTTLLQALAQSGGFTDFAATKRVQLRRVDRATGRENVWVVNYGRLTRGASAMGSVQLVEGDVILVPERGLFE